MSEVPSEPVYLGEHLAAGTEPFFNPSLVERFVTSINDAMGPEHADKHLDTTVYDENNLTAYIGVYEIDSNYAAKAAHAVVLYLQGVNRTQIMRLANESFVEYMPKDEPQRITESKVKTIRDAAIEVIARRIVNDDYEPPSLLNDRLKEPRQIRGNRPEVLTPHAALTWNLIELCNLSGEEAMALRDWMNPGYDRPMIGNAQAMAVKLVRELVSSNGLLGKKNETLKPTEKKLIHAFLDKDFPQSAYMLAKRRSDAGGADARNIAPIIRRGLEACVDFIKEERIRYHPNTARLVIESMRSDEEPRHRQGLDNIDIAEAYDVDSDFVNAVYLKKKEEGLFKGMQPPRPQKRSDGRMTLHYGGAVLKRLLPAVDAEVKERSSRRAG
jgi:hypothetical protein